ncbi:GNAT family N-acetyltransferase [Chryseolinea sp. T2]|uniref:GNAT family N-acetyltransferase n=1 Tax=Chryseolinea sp. T2 TaxID=3129255 RepID=UPI0030783ADC
MTTSTLFIREATEADSQSIWEIIHEVISSGDTYAFAPDTSKSDMLGYWFANGAHPFVAMIDDKIAGTYVIRNNQPGLGSHIANGAFMTSSRFRKNGVGRAMGMHSLKAAKQLGYMAMQFNFVVKSNTRAVALWQSLGFEIMAEIPNAFKHTTNGLTNTYIMYRNLDDQSS